MEKLQHLLDEGIIDEVFQQLKTGKEAEVWLVSHRGEPVAAKLYKEREFRSFKNDSGYLEGRQVRNTRTQRAMDNRTAFGKRAAEEAWKSAEADAMYALVAAGVRVPKPVLFYDGVLLMEVIGDHEGRVAPRLVEVGVTPEQAMPMYEHLRGEVIKMLTADLIHGDLSEFNILIGVDGPVIIDFPQVVTAARNSRSEQFFRRDLGNLIRFFSAVNPEVAKHAGDPDEIWRAYTRRELSAGFVPTGKFVPKPPPQQQRNGRGGRGPDQRRDQNGRGPQVEVRGAPQQAGAAVHGGRPANNEPRRDGRPQQPGAPRNEGQNRRDGRPQQTAPHAGHPANSGHQATSGGAPTNRDGRGQQPGAPVNNGMNNQGRRDGQNRRDGRPPQQHTSGGQPANDNGRPQQTDRRDRPPQQQAGANNNGRSQQNDGRRDQNGRGRNDQRPNNGAPQQARGPRGPEVSFKGQAPSSGGQHPPAGREGRRRPPRRW
ncbi:MAG: RIO1 family regulatory kinase/ATPase [Myxococcaceae bacterium]